MKMYRSLTELIGHTPLLALTGYCRENGLNATIAAKLEAFNPAGSVKDRTACAMLDAAEASGALIPGGTIIEPTSGNTGIGLAWVAAARGYRTLIVMPDSMSPERRALIRAYGAELVLTDGALGMKGAIARAQELHEQIAGSLIPDQVSNPANPAALTADEEKIAAELVRSFAESERLQRHVQFLYAHGAFYKMCYGNLLYHGAVPMTEDGAFAAIRFAGIARSGKQLFDYCDRRARQGYSAPAGSPARLAGQGFLWYLWCGAKSPLFGRSAMTTFERLYIADPAAQVEIKDPYYRHIADPRTAEHILREFGLSGEGSYIVNGHVPVRAIEGESPIKGGGRLIIIDGGFCRAYHRRTGIAGYTLVYNSRGLILRTHQPFESVEKAIHEDEDIASKSEYIYTALQRILVRDTDEGGRKLALIRDLTALVEAYQSGVIAQGVAQEM